jgi:hypothetical protein
VAAALLAASDSLLYQPSKHDDLWVVRFLLSHKRSVKASIKAPQHTLQFRAQHKLDDTDIRYSPSGPNVPCESFRKYYDYCHPDIVDATCIALLGLSMENFSRDSRAMTNAQVSVGVPNTGLDSDSVAVGRSPTGALEAKVSTQQSNLTEWLQLYQSNSLFNTANVLGKGLGKLPSSEFHPPTPSLKRSCVLSFM